MEVTPRTRRNSHLMPGFRFLSSNLGGAAGRAAVNAIRDYNRRNINKRKAPSDSDMLSRGKRLKAMASKSRSFTQGEKGTSRAVKVKVKGKEGKKKRKIVKVSKELRLKVNKCIEEKKIRGHYQVVTYSIKTFPPSHTQIVSGGFQDNLGLSCSFTALEFLHQASVLFNGKADALRSTTSLINSIGVTDISGADVNLPSNQTSSLACTAKFTVLNSYEKIYVKNNSDRTVWIDLYICEPKKAMYDGQASVDTAGTLMLPGPGESSNPSEMWIYALNQGNKTGQNIGNIPITTLHTNPLGLPAFTSNFKSSKLSVKLEPGQDWNYVLQGPKMLDIDFSKYYKGSYATGEGALQPVQKFSRALLWVIKQDLVSVSNAAGRWSGNVIENRPNLLCVERTICGSYTVPESTGMRVNGVALATKGDAPLQNNYKRPCYFSTVYAPVATGALLRVDEQNSSSNIVG